MIPNGWWERAHFQVVIAERWRERGAGTRDPFARFFFLFAGLNALYALWIGIDPIDGAASSDRPPNEGRQIENLLRKAGPSAPGVLDAAVSCVDYFADRRPIERMDRRSPSDARREGRIAQRTLRDGDDADRLVALGTILYLVRSNLVHGSKMDAGDDQEVIERAVVGLKAVLDWAINHTQSELRAS